MHSIRRPHTPHRFRAQLSYKRAVGKWQTERLILLPFYRFIRSFSNKIHIFAASLWCDDFGYRTVASPFAKVSLWFHSLVRLHFVMRCHKHRRMCTVCECKWNEYTFLLFCFDANVASMPLTQFGKHWHFYAQRFHGINKKNRATERTSAHKTTDAAASILKLFGLRSFDFV